MGIHYAHMAGNDDGSPLVHGDLRPETVMVCFNGVSKVMGYGALSVAPREREGRRVRNQRYYSAPEQLLGGRDAATVRTDVFLLGLLLHECLSGRMPFHEWPDIDKAILQRQLPALPSDVPRALDEVIRRATAKRAEDRYPSALAFREALIEAVNGLPSAATLTDFLEEIFPPDSEARATRRQMIELGRAELARPPTPSSTSLPAVAAPVAAPSEVLAEPPAPLPAPAFASEPVPAPALAPEPAPAEAPSSPSEWEAAPAPPAPATDSVEEEPPPPLVPPEAAAAPASAQSEDEVAEQDIVEARPIPPVEERVAEALDKELELVATRTARPGVARPRKPATAQSASARSRKRLLAGGAAAAVLLSAAAAFFLLSSREPSSPVAPAPPSGAATVAHAPPEVPPAPAPALPASEDAGAPAVAAAPSPEGDAGTNAATATAQPGDAGTSAAPEGAVALAGGSPAPNPEGAVTPASGQATGTDAPAGDTKTPPAKVTTLLQLAVQPPVDVFLEGKKLGRTPLKVPLPPGAYTLELSNPAKGVKATRSITVGPRGTTKQSLRLGKGSVVVRAPAGARILVDGRKAQSKLSLYEGEHHIVVTAGKARWEKSFQLDANERRVLTPELHKKR
jgi:serine/threonine-protein kinase